MHTRPRCTYVWFKGWWNLFCFERAPIEIVIPRVRFEVFDTIATAQPTFRVALKKLRGQGARGVG